MPDAPEPPCTRRRFVRQTGLLALGALAAPILKACSPPEPERLLGQLPDLKREGHWLRSFNDEPLFVGLQPNGQPYALSRTCTHRQCTVAWRPGAGRFVCPCHRGQYDARGQVLHGKPPKPLKRFALEVRRGTEVWVLNREP